MKKYTLFSTLISIFIIMFIPTSVFAAGATTTDVKALEQTLRNLQAESDRLSAAQTVNSGASADIPFTHSFGYRATDAKTGGEVSRLQKLLLRDKTIYPEGLVSGFFGKATEKALQRWQSKNKIVTSGTPNTTGYGWVGKKTREILNKELISGPRATGALSVTIAPNITSSKALTKSVILTNTISTKFVGAGNGTKVSFTQTGMPAGVTVSSGLSCTAPCTVENKVTVAPGVFEGVYPINVKAVSGKESANGVYLIQIGEPQKYAIRVTASSSNIILKKTLGGSISGSNDIIIRTLTGDPQPVVLTQQSRTKGITLSNLGSCTPPCSKRNTVQVGLDVPTGQHSITVTAVGGGATSSVNYTVSLGYNDEFGFHIANQDDPDKQITITQPASVSATTYVPLKFILDGGSPSYGKVTMMANFPTGLGATINGCTLPCDQTLAITAGPTVKIGTFGISFTVDAEYIDKKTGEKKILKKTYTESVKVVLGDAGRVL